MAVRPTMKIHVKPARFPSLTEVFVSDLVFCLTFRI